MNGFETKFRAFYDMITADWFSKIPKEKQLRGARDTEIRKHVMHRFEIERIVLCRAPDAALAFWFLFIVDEMSTQRYLLD